MFIYFNYLYKHEATVYKHAATVYKHAATVYKHAATVYKHAATYTANSMKVDVDNSEMCNMQQQKIMELITVSHANVKIYLIKYYICNPVRPPMC